MILSNIIFAQSYTIDLYSLDKQNPPNGILDVEVKLEIFNAAMQHVSGHIYYYRRGNGPPIWAKLKVIMREFYDIGQGIHYVWKDPSAAIRDPSNPQYVYLFYTDTYDGYEYQFDMHHGNSRRLVIAESWVEYTPFQNSKSAERKNIIITPDNTPPSFNNGTITLNAPNGISKTINNIPWFNTKIRGQSPGITDSTSGPDYIAYSYDNTSHWTRGNISSFYSTPGKHTLYFRGYDKVGNHKTIQKTFCYDPTPPKAVSGITFEKYLYHKKANPDKWTENFYKLHGVQAAWDKPYDPADAEGNIPGCGVEDYEITVSGPNGDIKMNPHYIDTRSLRPYGVQHENNHDTITLTDTRYSSDVLLEFKNPLSVHISKIHLQYAYKGGPFTTGLFTLSEDRQGTKKIPFKLTAVPFFGYANATLKNIATNAKTLYLRLYSTISEQFNVKEIKITTEPPARKRKDNWLNINFKDIPEDRRKGFFGQTKIEDQLTLHVAAYDYLGNKNQPSSKSVYIPPEPDSFHIYHNTKEPDKNFSFGEPYYDKTAEHVRYPFQLTLSGSHNLSKEKTNDRVKGFNLYCYDPTPKGRDFGVHKVNDTIIKWNGTGKYKYTSELKNTEHMNFAHRNLKFFHTLVVDENNRIPDDGISLNLKGSEEYPEGGTLKVPNYAGYTVNLLSKENSLSKRDATDINFNPDSYCIVYFNKSKWIDGEGDALSYRLDSKTGPGILFNPVNKDYQDLKYHEAFAGINTSNAKNPAFKPYTILTEANEEILCVLRVYEESAYEGKKDYGTKTNLTLRFNGADPGSDFLLAIRDDNNIFDLDEDDEDRFFYKNNYYLKVGHKYPVNPTIANDIYLIFYPGDGVTELALSEVDTGTLDPDKYISQQLDFPGLSYSEFEPISDYTQGEPQKRNWSGKKDKVLAVKLKDRNNKIGYVYKLFRYSETPLSPVEGFQKKLISKLNSTAVNRVRFNWKADPNARTYKLILIDGKTKHTYDAAGGTELTIDLKAINIGYNHPLKAKVVALAGNLTTRESETLEFHSSAFPGTHKIEEMTTRPQPPDKEKGATISLSWPVVGPIAKDFILQTPDPAIEPGLDLKYADNKIKLIGLNPNQSYDFRIAARNNDSEPSAHTFDFTYKDKNYSPVIESLDFPAEYADSKSIPFKWTAWDPDGYVLYDLYLDGEIIARDLTNNEFTYNNKDGLTGTHEWKVMAKDGVNDPVSSQVAGFKIDSLLSIKAADILSYSNQEFLEVTVNTGPSGLAPKECYYVLDSKKYDDIFKAAENKPGPHQFAIPLNKEGSYSILIHVENKVHTAAEKTVNVSIDRTKPEVSLTEKDPQAPIHYSNGEFIFSLQAKDPLSGLSSWSYGFVDSAAATYENYLPQETEDRLSENSFNIKDIRKPVILPESATHKECYFAYAVSDHAGNIFYKVLEKPIYLDKDPPRLDAAFTGLSAHLSEYYISDMNHLVLAHEPILKDTGFMPTDYSHLIHYSLYKSDAKPKWYSTWEEARQGARDRKLNNYTNGAVYQGAVKGEDLAGNPVYVKTPVFTLDETAPSTPGLKGYDKLEAGKPVHLTVRSTDDQGTPVIEYSLSISGGVTAAVPHAENGLLTRDSGDFIFTLPKGLAGSGYSITIKAKNAALLTAESIVHNVEIKDSNALIVHDSGPYYGQEMPLDEALKIPVSWNYSGSLEVTGYDYSFHKTELKQT